MEESPPPIKAEESKSEPKHKRQLRELFSIFKEDSVILRLFHFLYKEGKAMKEGWAAFLVLAIVVSLITYWLSGDWLYQPRIDELKDALAKSDGAKEESERDRDKYQTLFNQDENTMAPLRDTANKQFSAADPAKRLDLLIQKLDSFQNEIDSKITISQNPANERITTATAAVTVVFSVDKSIPASNAAHNMGAGGLAAFGQGTLALLIATNSLESDSFVTGDGKETIAVTCSMVPDSLYAGKPISSLKDSQFIQIECPLIPQNATILGGNVRWIINSVVTLTFPIPPQKASGSHIMITDLNDGLKPLSSVPNTSASPP